MLPKHLAELTDSTLNECMPIALKLQSLGLEIRGASRQNDLYKYRLAPKGEKLILAHFNSLDEITKYLDDLTLTNGETTMTL